MQEIIDSGGRAVAVQGDASKEDDTKRMVREVVEEFGGLGDLVNNADIESERPFLQRGLAAGEKVVSVNLNGAFLVSREIVKGMVVNVSGVHERIPH